MFLHKTLLRRAVLFVEPFDLAAWEMRKLLVEMEQLFPGRRGQNVTTGETFLPLV